jgi:hypothetical protein
MKQFINLYSQVLADDGFLIFEDVQCFEWIDILKNVVPRCAQLLNMLHDLPTADQDPDDPVTFINTDPEGPESCQPDARRSSRPMSPSPHAHSFVIGPAVINNNTHHDVRGRNC